MFETTLSIENEKSPLLQKLWSGMTGNERTDINAVGGRSATEGAKEYHRQYNQSGLWRGNRSFGSGASEYGDKVTNGWNMQEPNPAGVTIANDAEHLAHKVNGGTITAKRAKALTIPMIEGAHGVTARDYARNNNTVLFTMKGKNALFEKTSTGIRAVYALVKSVTQKPWKGALPPDKEIIDAFTKGYKKGLIDHIEKR